MNNKEYIRKERQRKGNTIRNLCNMCLYYKNQATTLSLVDEQGKQTAHGVSINKNKRWEVLEDFLEKGEPLVVGRAYTWDANKTITQKDRFVINPENFKTAPKEGEKKQKKPLDKKAKKERRQKQAERQRNSESKHTRQKHKNTIVTTSKSEDDEPEEAFDDKESGSSTEEEEDDEALSISDAELNEEEKKGLSKEYLCVLSHIGCTRINRHNILNPHKWVCTHQNTGKHHSAQKKRHIRQARTQVRGQIAKNRVLGAEDIPNHRDGYLSC